MANPTTNYGFVLPTPTDLVTDLPADFDVALQGVDTRLKALQPGTTLGDLAYSSATANTNTRLGIGTAGQMLQVNSGATAPEWVTSSSGAFTELASGTLVSGTTNLTSIVGTYKDLVLVLRNAKTSSDGSPIAVRVNADNGANRYRNLENNSAGAAFDNTRWYVTSDQDNSVATGLTYIRFFDYANTDTWKLAQNNSISTDDITTTSVAWNKDMLAYNQTTAISEINILAYSGTISGGTYILYGVK